MWYPDASSCLATIDMGWKLGAVPPFWGGGELGPHLTQCRRPGLSVSDRPGTRVSGRRLSAYFRRQFAPSPIDRYSDLRRPAFKQQFRRPVFCSRRTTSVEHVASTAIWHCDSIGQFKRLLKTYLFGAWDRGALWHLLGAPCINHLTYLLNVAGTEAYLQAKCHLDPSNPLATIGPIIKYAYNTLECVDWHVIFE